MPALSSTSVRSARIVRCLVVVLLAIVLGACTATDDGIRVRDRDGAGVPFEDQS
jgi:hypothetical protein